MFKLLNWRKYDKKTTEAVDMPFVYLNGSVEDVIGYDQIVVLGSTPLPPGYSDVEVIGYDKPCKAFVVYKNDNPEEAEGCILDADEIMDFLKRHPDMLV